MYVTQLRKPQSERNLSVQVSFPPVQIKLERSRSVDDPSVYQDIEWLLDHLRENDLISAHRPDGFSWLYRAYVYEEMEATRVVLPRKAFEPIEDVIGPTEAEVWVSNPDETMVTYFVDKAMDDESWLVTGAFLYLVDTYKEDRPPGRLQMSGLSSLKMLALELGIRFLNPKDGEGWEPLGRGSFDHPIEKLGKMGGIVTDTRRISSLYKVRYISDEQGYVLNGERARVCDVLAYPIFIEAHDVPE